MATLVDIADLEKIVLFDSSANNLGNFTQGIHDVKKYADLDRDLLTDVQRGIIEFSEFIEKENTFTVEATLTDFENLSRLVGTTQEFLNLNQGRTPKKYIGRGENKQLLFEEISNAIFNVTRLLKSKFFIPEDKESYNAFYEAIPHIFDKFTSPSDALLSITRLYAALFYLSLSQKTPVAIVSRKRMAHYGLDLLTRGFREISQNPSLLQEFPIKLYFDTTQRDYKVIYTTQNEKPA